MKDVVRIENGSESSPLQAQLGRHIRTDPTTLAKYCYNTLGSVSEDIAAIVESLALADRLSPRRRSKTWARQIHVTVPVLNPSVFKSAQNYEALIDTISFLSGDEWALDFIQRHDRPSVDEYLPLVREAPKYVVPYSDGLDSLSQARLLEDEFGRNNILRVRAGILEDTDSKINVPVLRVRRGFKMGRVREQTYRTRPLVFYSFAAIAAVTAGAEAVVIGESGQGAIGPSFAIYADEWPLRSSHPGFLFRLQTFLTLTLGKSVEFIQPQLWRTKGDVLRELKSKGLSHGWETSRSCSLRPRERRGRRSCGFCGGCVLRRVSAAAAGLDEDNDYAFNLGSGLLQLTNKSGRREAMTLNDRQILMRSVGSMASVAAVMARPDADGAIARELEDIPHHMQTDAAIGMPKLLRSHSAEWSSFIHELPRDAWLAQRLRTDA